MKTTFSIAAAILAFSANSIAATPIAEPESNWPESANSLYERHLLLVDGDERLNTRDLFLVNGNERLRRRDLFLVDADEGLRRRDALYSIGPDEVNLMKRAALYAYLANGAGGLNKRDLELLRRDPSWLSSVVKLVRKAFSTASKAVGDIADSTNNN